jgi:hypothetical protein
VPDAGVRPSSSVATSSTQAWSFGDGRFSFTAPLGQAPTVGTPVVVTRPDGRELLGQVGRTVLAEGPSVMTADVGDVQLLGDGDLVASLGDVDSRTEPFAAGRVATAPAPILRGWLESRLGNSARLDLGTARPGALGPVQLAAAGFTRHTFLCGQSGSGKTYTLGLLIEQLFLRTDLKVVVFDPNSDYVHATQIDSDGLSGEEQRRADALPDTVRVFRHHGVHRLRVRYGRLPLDQQALALELDPIEDAELYDSLRRVVQGMPDTEYSLHDLRGRLDPLEEPARKLALRIDNLAAADWSVWAGKDDVPLVDQLPAGWRGAILDLGELPNPRERSAIVASILSALWEWRHRREPVLIVIDEAHNVCPAVPADRAQALAIEHMIRIAAEGRKYGLYLFLSTQRPDRLHPEVLAQCENLVLMKVNAAATIDLLAQTFSHVPRRMIELAPTFTMGQGLVAGRISPLPMLFSSGRRRSPQGGADVPATWASTVPDSLGAARNL